jgi:hypothetical protein
MLVMSHHSQYYQRWWTFYLVCHDSSLVDDEYSSVLKDILSHFLPQIACIHLNLLCDMVENDSFPGWYCDSIFIGHESHRFISSALHDVSDNARDEYCLHFSNVYTERTFLYDDVREGRVTLYNLYKHDCDIKEEETSLFYHSIFVVLLLLDAYCLNSSFMITTVSMFINAMMIIAMAGTFHHEMITQLFLTDFNFTRVITPTGSSEILRNISILLHIIETDNLENDSSSREMIAYTIASSLYYIFTSKPLITVMTIFVLYEYYKARGQSNKIPSAFFYQRSLPKRYNYI